MTNFLQMKGICKKSKKEGEKLRNESINPLWISTGFYNNIFVLKKPPHFNDVILTFCLIPKCL
jgi:hypothetical protein